MHLHLIPRYRNDGFGLRFPPGYDQPPEREALDRTAHEIDHAMGRLNPNPPKEGVGSVS